MKKKRKAVSLSPQLEQLLSSNAGLEDGLRTNKKLLQDLAGAVKALSDAYVEPEKCDWKALYKNTAAVNAYLLYYLPVNLVKLFPLLDELAKGGAFDVAQRQHMSVLDIGCGPGTFMLGLLEYICRAGRPEASFVESISLTGIDRSKDNLAAADRLIRQYCSPGCLPQGMTVTASFRQGSVLSPDFLNSPELFDIIIAGNVLAELQGAALPSCLSALTEHLAPDGVLIIIDPGTRRAAQRLLELRNMLLQHTELRLFAPCLCAAACPLQDDSGQWCHEKLFWQPTEAVRQIDGVLGFTKEKGIKYSFLSFVKKDVDRLSPYADLAHENIWRVGSYVIKNKGEDRLWVCNGRERLLLRRLERNSSETNSDFEQAERGDIVFVDGAVPRAVFHDLPKEAVFRIIH
ncbi:MAG: methyltransferase domain-containing protein [Deltaproteobacteria bacterium]|nr:methyltransferase domain-containing protein [Deltaproteobacteria bacterium]